MGEQTAEWIRELESRRADQRAYVTHKENVIYLAVGAEMTAAWPLLKDGAPDGIPLSLFILLASALVHVFVRWQARQRSRASVLIEAYNRTISDLITGSPVDSPQPTPVVKGSARFGWLVCAIQIDQSLVGSERHLLLLKDNLRSVVAEMLEPLESKSRVRKLVDWFVYRGSEIPSLVTGLISCVAALNLGSLVVRFSYEHLGDQVYVIICP